MNNHSKNCIDLRAQGYPNCVCEVGIKELWQRPNPLFDKLPKVKASTIEQEVMFGGQEPSNTSPITSDRKITPELIDAILTRLADYKEENWFKHRDLASKIEKLTEQVQVLEGSVNDCKLNKKKIIWAELTDHDIRLNEIDDKLDILCDPTTEKEHCKQFSQPKPIISSEDENADKFLDAMFAKGEEHAKIEDLMFPKPIISSERIAFHTKKGSLEIRFPINNKDEFFAVYEKYNEFLKKTGLAK